MICRLINGVQELIWRLRRRRALKKANTDMRGVNFSEKKLDNGIIVSVVTIDSENAVRATGQS